MYLGKPENIYKPCSVHQSEFCYPKLANKKMEVCMGQLVPNTHTPSSMIKITIDFDETSSLSSVTYHCQIMVVMRTNLALTRMNHTPSSMMNIPIDFDGTSSLSSATYHCQIMVVMRTDLALTRMTHTPCTMVKITIDFDDRASLSCNLPLSNYGRHAYRFGTYSYDPYTKLNDEDYNRFWWNIIII